MYCSAIPLKYLTLKVGHQAYLYHQVIAYDHGIAYALITFAVFDMEAMIKYLVAIKLRYAKSHFDVMRRAVHANGSNIFDFI